MPFEIQAMLSVDDWSNQTAALSTRLSSWPASKFRSRQGQSTSPSPGSGMSAGVVEEGSAIFSAVMGALSASLSSRQLSALLCTGLSMATEIRAGPGAGRHENSQVMLGGIEDEPAYEVSLEIAEACLVVGSNRQCSLSLAESPYFAAPSGGPVQLLLGAPCIRAGLEGCLKHKLAQPRVYVSMISPLIWRSPNTGVYLPVTDVYIDSKQADAHIKSKLYARTGAALPTPRIATQGSSLASHSPECGTAIPHETEVLFTLHDLQIEVKPPAGAVHEQSGKRDAFSAPPLQIFIAAAKAVSRCQNSLEEYNACTVLGLALRTPLLPEMKETNPSNSSPNKPLHLHFSLTILEAAFHSTDKPPTGAEGNSSYLTSLHGGNLVISFEQRSCRVGSHIDLAQNAQSHKASKQSQSFLRMACLLC